MVVHVVKISAHSKLYLACISNSYYALIRKTMVSHGCYLKINPIFYLLNCNILPDAKQYKYSTNNNSYIWQYNYFISTFLFYFSF